MIDKNIILESIDHFDKIYDRSNNNLNCFTNNLSNFSRSLLDTYHGDGKLSGKLIAVKDNNNIQKYPTTWVSQI